ncbi:hypothetical protein MLD38_040787 [Melastoma candidum]|nr:hypothetical protein MLD38_040787 [Melastoma candidum]
MKSPHSRVPPVEGTSYALSSGVTGSVNLTWETFVLMQDFVPEDLESITGFELSQSPPSSYNSLFLGSEDYAKEPPVVPPHLQLTLLNVSSVQMEIPPPLSRPQHVVLNHLYMQKGKNSPAVVALGSKKQMPETESRSISIYVDISIVDISIYVDISRRS